MNSNAQQKNNSSISVKREPFAMAYQSVIFDNDLSAPEFRTLLSMLLLGHGKMFYGSQETLASALGKHWSTILPHFHALELKNYIIVERRAGRTSLITFTSKALPLGETQGGTGINPRRIYNINKVYINQYLRIGSKYLAKDFERRSGINSERNLDIWRESYAKLYNLGFRTPEMFDINEYVTKNSHWKSVVESPLKYLGVDRHGELYAERFLRESKELVKN